MQISLTNIQTLLFDGMETLQLTTTESVLLLALIKKLLSETDINPISGKREFPLFRNIDLREFDLKVLHSLQIKLSNYLD
jgi:hypothetical protein